MDAWYVGYVPQLTTSVWVGYPEERVPMVDINGLPEINGENYPLDIYAAYMRDAVDGLPVEELDTPSDDLKLAVKTSGRAYVEPEKTSPTTGGTTGETTGGETTAPRASPSTPPPGQP